MMLGKIIEILTGLPVTKWMQKLFEKLSGIDYEGFKNYKYGSGDSLPLAYQDPNTVANNLASVPNSIYNNSTTYTYDQRAISQDIAINTQQPAADIQNQLIAANAYFAMV